MWQWPWAIFGGQPPAKPAFEEDEEDNPSTMSKDLDSDATLMDVNSEILDISHSSVLRRPHPPPYKKRTPKAQAAATKLAPQGKPPKVMAKVALPKTPVAKIEPTGPKLTKIPVVVVKDKKPKAPVAVPVVVVGPKKALLVRPIKKRTRKPRTPGDIDSAQTTGIRRRGKKKTRHRRPKLIRAKKQAVPVSPPKSPAGHPKALIGGQKVTPKAS